MLNSPAPICFPSSCIGCCLLRALMRFTTALVFVLICQRLLATDSVTIRTNYYEVSGDNLRSIRDDIVQRRPWKEERDAETRWTIDWSFTTEDFGSVCR